MKQPSLLEVRQRIWEMIKKVPEDASTIEIIKISEYNDGILDAYWAIAEMELEA
jgi:hypothetical protein